jgi:hypothetical protein
MLVLQSLTGARLASAPSGRLLADASSVRLPGRLECIRFLGALRSICCSPHIQRHAFTAAAAGYYFLHKWFNYERERLCIEAGVASARRRPFFFRRRQLLPPRLSHKMTHPPAYTVKKSEKPALFFGGAHATKKQFGILRCKAVARPTCKRRSG